MGVDELWRGRKGLPNLAGLRVSITTKTCRSGRKVATSGKSPSMGSGPEEKRCARRPVRPRGTNRLHRVPQPLGFGPVPSKQPFDPPARRRCQSHEGHVLVHLAVLRHFRASAWSSGVSLRGPTCTWTRSAQAVPFPAIPCARVTLNACTLWSCPRCL